ncbi:hypothetical protein J6O48_00620 [bacterium]|nr:hypothetical protein [bacterium]
MKLSFNSFTKLFRKNCKKVVEEPKRPIHKTDIKTTDDGVVKFQRMYTDAEGKSHFFTVETSVLEDGTKQTKTKVQDVQSDGSLYTYANEGVITNRTKKVKREKGGSILGGDRITIDKEYQETMSETAHTEKMIKEFDEKGKLQHKDYTLKYRHWDKAKHGTQDRIYIEAPLNHSAKDISDVNPTEHKLYKHSWNGHNNYHYFENGGESKYSKAIAAKEQARIDAAKAAEAARIAEEKAMAEYQKTLPIVNTGKVLNKDIKDFERIETTLPDGSIERKYFEAGKETPTIITKDKGILHQEWINGGKTDFLYIKKVGKEMYPYMAAKKDGYTFISRPTKSGGLIKEQLRHDGIKGYKGTEYGGELKIPYNKTQAYKNASPDRQAYYDKEVDQGYWNKIWTQSTYNSSNKGPEVQEEFDNARKSYIDLYDLIRPYEN